MPAFGAAGWPKALNPGDVVQVITATDTAAGNVTKSVPVTPVQAADGVGRALNFINATNQTATINVCDTATGTFQSTGYTVNGGAALPFNCIGPFVNVSFAVAPTSGYLAIAG